MWWGIDLASWIVLLLVGGFVFVVGRASGFQKGYTKGKGDMFTEMMKHEEIKQIIERGDLNGT